MKLLEIKNNLVKLSYEEGENLILGGFVTLSYNDKSYVAQFVNLKSDNIHHYAIGRLIFTFNNDGVVDDYDGSIPNLRSDITLLSAQELTNLLPIENPFRIGNIAQQDAMLSIDMSVLENNFTVFVQRNTDKETFISNCVRQLFRIREKSIVIDNSNMFRDYPKFTLGKDFKLPLNSQMMHYIFDSELADIDPNTKAVIQDIFYEVEEYIKTLDDNFLPIDSFVEVISSQYRQTKMPELALLKNRLLKYAQANIFANRKDEFTSLKNRININNCTVIDLSGIPDQLQKEALSYIHEICETISKYVYAFVELNDDNSDKKLLRKMVNNNHIFTTFITSHEYKYAKELRSHAENVLLFAPYENSQDYMGLGTLLNKLNLGECIVYGKLTQGVPFITTMADLDLELTKDDVFGDREEFIPEDEFEQLREEIPNITNSIEPISINESVISSSTAEEPEPLQNSVEEPVIKEEAPPIQEPQPSSVQETYNIIEPVENILDTEDSQGNSSNVVDEIFENNISDTEDMNMDDGSDLSELTDDDLDFIEENQEYEVNDSQNESVDELFEEEGTIEPQAPVVPIYPAEEEKDEIPSDTQYKQGDIVTHPRYGKGVVEKVINYGNKTLCSIAFDEVGRRLLDPSISEFEMA